jgi:hypothetical protein
VSVGCGYRAMGTRFAVALPGSVGLVEFIHSAGIIAPAPPTAVAVVVPTGNAPLLGWIVTRRSQPEPIFFNAKNKYVSVVAELTVNDCASAPDGPTVFVAVAMLSEDDGVVKVNGSEVPDATEPA